jgi:uncharacterized protein YecT (DUF1311 family)
MIASRGMLVAALLLAVPSAAQAASFDCRKAATSAEKAICADPDLSMDDERMTASYRDRVNLYHGEVAAFVRQDQREWLNPFSTIDQPSGEVEPLCPASLRPKLTACLKELYRLRIAELRDLAYRFKGVYRLGEEALMVVTMSEKPSQPDFIIGVRPNGEGTERFWHVDNAAGPSSSRMTGDNSVEVELGSDEGLPPCVLALRFDGGGVDVLPRSGPCSGNAFTGRYTRRDESPRAWDLDIHW